MSAWFCIYTIPCLGPTGPPPLHGVGTLLASSKWLFSWMITGSPLSSILLIFSDSLLLCCSQKGVKLENWNVNHNLVGVCLFHSCFHFRSSVCLSPSNLNHTFVWLCRPNFYNLNKALRRQNGTFASTKSYICVNKKVHLRHFSGTFASRSQCAWVAGLWRIRRRHIFCLIL